MRWLLIPFAIVILSLVILAIVRKSIPEYHQHINSRNFEILDSLPQLSPVFEKSEVGKKEIAMLVFVDPACAYCQIAVSRLATEPGITKDLCVILISVNTPNNYLSNLSRDASCCFYEISDATGDLHETFGYPSTPSYFIYRKGQLAEQFAGLQTTHKLMNSIYYEKQKKTSLRKAGKQE